MTNTQKLDEMINDLPENFADAKEIIKADIVPLMVGFEKALAQHYIKKISKKTGTDQKIIMQLMREALDEMEDKQEDDPEVLEGAEWFGKDPQAFRKRIDMLNESGLVGERKNQGIVSVVIDSRLKMEGSESESLGVKVEGGKGSGKSAIIKNCLKLQVEEQTYTRMTAATANSIYYMGDSLKHKFIYLEEGQDLKRDNDFAYVVRNLLSEEKAKKTVLESHFGKYQPVDYEVDGPVSFGTTSIYKNLESQFEDRLFTIHSDSSSAQTDNILKNRFKKASKLSQNNYDKILRAWQIHHSSLVPYKVIIPFAEYIVPSEQKLPTTARRAFERIVAAIEAVTLFHQKKRYLDDAGCLVANMADYYIVYQLFQDTLLESIGQYHLVKDDKFKIIRAEGMISPANLAQRLGISIQAISKWSQRYESDLMWCDKNGDPFEKEVTLKQYKSRGKTYLKLRQFPGLPSPYQLTGDPEWAEGGKFHEMYNLHLDLNRAYFDPADPEPTGLRSLKSDEAEIDIMETIE